MSLYHCLQCVRWLTRLYEERGGLAVLQAGDEALPSRVLAAAHTRRPILVLNTPTYLTHNLRKLIDIPFLVMGGEGERPDVLLVLVTGSAAPQLPIELSVHFTRVSFALPPLVLEERLLNDVFKMEREDLFEQRANLTASLKKDHKALTAVDDNILQKLTQASTALLDNEELLAAFYEAKATSSEFRTRLAESKRTLHKIGNVRDKYRPVATRARLLFSTSTALTRLDPNYVFSFRHFLHAEVLRAAVARQGGRAGDHSDGPVEGLGVEERKLPVLVWTDHGRDVAREEDGEVECCGTGLVLEAGSPTLSIVLDNVVQQGGWVVVQGAESRVVLPTLLEAITSLDSPDIKVSDES
ncbi:hypothetical protein Pmani_008437 [Petrolisthes manimaculis]|uniref:Dynein heavy chain ATP-binding dynein motor region domain-containing protein n=1 Tax=Petrolisthes manimaculis TaxID=1843537 RepID=A0AAE1Q6D2_9EUCA|nr:hypothetical protein Pmani_008437 [Petrolisthes manimaculis]